MLDSVEAFRRLLWIILSAGIGAVMLAFAGLVLSRLARRAAAARRARIQQRYHGAVSRLMAPGTAAGAVAELAAAPRAHRRLIGNLLLRPLRVARGDLSDTTRRAAAALGRDRVWRQEIEDRRWWVRSEAARALGLIRDRDSVPLLKAALDDPHDEVRAAAVEALGLAGDSSVIPTLLARLASESKHQRVRIVEALRQFGEAATPALIAHARAFPDDRLAAAVVLGHIGGSGALRSLTEWMDDAAPAVRAAATAAAGAIGLDDRTFYFVLRNLGDDSPEVRAAAARAVSRPPRPGTAVHIEPLLGDIWDVAVEAALSLKRLGHEGHDVLRRAVQTAGAGADLASQMLWDGPAASGGGQS